MNKRRYLVDELHVDGFKTDGGEFIYDDSVVFFNGKKGNEMRNPYPNLYVNGYYNFLQRNDGITFSRAGYVGAQTNPMHWAGDQVSTFEELQAQIRAGLSLGLSGVPFWGFDIAGFAGELPTTELFLRATEVATFSPVMQFHAEPRTGQFGDCNRRSWVNDRSPWNMAEVNKDDNIIEVYRKYANIRMNLIPYIYNEAYYCAKNGRPLFGHLIIDYPKDEKVLNMEDEYLFGRYILVAPFVKEGMTEREIYLPEGTWYDFWTHDKIEGCKTYRFKGEAHEIPVFVKAGSLIPLNLGDGFSLGESVGNKMNTYSNLCFNLYGETGESYFHDDLGNDFNITYKNNEILIKGERKESVISVIMDKKLYKVLS
jgi:alpha-glucosidase (family GH31 glycosyl hydrolase)